MKKIISLHLIIVSFVLLCSCTQNKIITDTNFTKYNYNNLYNGVHNTFCAQDGTVFYDSDGFYNLRVFVYKDGKKTKLLENRDFLDEEFYGNFFAINNFAYFETFSETDEKYHIYKYLLAENKYEKIHTTDNLYTWMATQNYIAFFKFSDIGYNDNELYDLYYYDIIKQKETMVCENVAEFGIVKNKLRYIIPNDNDTLELFEFDFYNKITQKLSEINFKNTKQQVEELLLFNFSEDYTTIYDYGDSAFNNFIVWETNGIKRKYSLPLPIQQFCIGDKFAYAICFEDINSEYILHKVPIKNKNNGIYKINLSTGEYEKIYDKIDDDTNIIVISDDEIYITQGNMTFIGLYKTTVYQYNVNKYKIEKLFVY